MRGAGIRHFIKQQPLLRRKKAPDMSGSSTGRYFTVTTWGESHGSALGAVIDGCPAGLSVTENDIQEMLDRRKPGQSKYTTKRQEGDKARILSGIFQGVSTGTPISVIVENTDQHSSDYEELKDVYRPGHADYTYDAKYGIRDWRGGGRSSGRETIGRVIGGAVAKLLLREFGIEVTAYARSIGPVIVPAGETDLQQASLNPFCLPNEACAAQAEKFVAECMKNGDSAGGIIECIITGCPAGLGDPVFCKLDGELAKAVMSVGAVKGVEIGDGFRSAELYGSSDNDAFAEGPGGHITKLSNHCGGILGGISDGSDIIIRAAIKPTPSISQPQRTVRKDGTETEITIHGRHDPLIVPRAVVVAESMASVVLADALIANAGSRMESLHRIYDL